MYLLRVYLTLYVFLASPHHITCTRWMYACLCCFLGYAAEGALPLAGFCLRTDVWSLHTGIFAARAPSACYSRTSTCCPLFILNPGMLVHVQ